MKKFLIALILAALFAALALLVLRPDLLDRFHGGEESVPESAPAADGRSEAPVPAPTESVPREGPRAEPPAAPQTGSLLLDRLADRAVYVNGIDVAGRERIELPPGPAVVASWADGRWSQERVTITTGEDILVQGTLRESETPAGWTGFQGDGRRTGLARSPARERFTLRWQGEVGDEVRSSPVIHQGMAFFASDTSFIRAVDLDGGEELWSSGIVGSKVSPAAIGDFVFAGNDVGRFEGFRAAKGKLRGTVALGSGLAGLAAVSDDLLLATTSGGRVLGIATRKSMVGRLPLKFRWAVTVPKLAGSTATPLVLGDRVVLQAADGTLLALATGDGRVLWPAGLETSSAEAAVEEGGSDMSFRFVSGRSFLTPTPAASGDVIYSVHGNRLRAVSAADGSLRWERHIGADPASSVSLAWGTVYLGCTDGSVRAFSADGGTPLFTARLGREPVFASPVLFDGRLLAATGEGKLALLDAFSGAPLAEDDTLAGAAIDATPAVWRDGILAINRSGRMACFE